MQSTRPSSSNSAASDIEQQNASSQADAKDQKGYQWVARVVV